MMNYDDLNYALLVSLGLYVDNNNFVVVDQNDLTMNNILTFKGKKLKYGIPEEDIDKRTCALFQPAINASQAKLLLNIFLNKLYEEENKYCSLQYLLLIYASENIFTCFNILLRWLYWYFQMSKK